jgi:uncharacterized alpha-E superfamily protein
MLSRVADAVYWMSRSLERADNVARFIEVNAHLMLDLELERGSAQWRPIVLTTADEADFNERYHDASEENVISFLTFDEKNPNSIFSCIQNARENARTVREVIVSELWETINELYLLVSDYSRKRHVTDLRPFYRQIKQSNHLFVGLAENAMSHGEPWHFMRMGRMLERADKTSRMLDVKYFSLLPKTDYVDSPYDAVEWGAVLKSVSGFEMYRKQHHAIRRVGVTDFLIFDPDFPRSVQYCVQAASESLNTIASMLQVEVPAQVEMKKLCKMLEDTHIEEVLANGLHEFVDVFEFNLNVVDQAIYRSFVATSA